MYLRVIVVKNQTYLHAWLLVDGIALALILAVLGKVQQQHNAVFRKHTTLPMPLKICTIII